MKGGDIMALSEIAESDSKKPLLYGVKTMTVSPIRELEPHLDEMFGAAWGVSLHGHHTRKTPGGSDYAVKELVFKFSSVADRSRFTSWWASRKAGTARGH